MSDSQNLNARLEEATRNPQNLGELANADAIGTAGSIDCGDMLRMWVKFREDSSGRKVIDKASFQTFGCETAIAVASVATELLKGKTVDQALAMDGRDLSAPLGPLPPMKIHCAQLVEGALRDALAPKIAPDPVPDPKAPAPKPTGNSLFDQLSAGTVAPAGKAVKIVLSSKSDPS